MVCVVRPWKFHCYIYFWIWQELNMPLNNAQIIESKCEEKMKNLLTKNGEFDILAYCRLVLKTSVPKGIEGSIPLLSSITMRV